MSDKKTFDDKMERLANEAADRLIGNGCVDEMFLDAFKVLSGYQASSRKLSKVLSLEEVEGGGGFGAAKKRIEAASVPLKGNLTGGTSTAAASGGTDGEPFN